MRNFINLANIDKRELRKIIDHAKLQKEKRSNLKRSAMDPNIPLTGRTLIDNVSLSVKKLSETVTVKSRLPLKSESGVTVN